MSVGPTFRLIALAAVVIVGLTGCGRDQRGALTAVEKECAAAAHVTEGLIDSGGAQDPALVANLVALSEVASPSVRSTTDKLVSLADVEEPSAKFQTEWYAVLDDLDRVLLDRCAFSIRALVTDAGLHVNSADDSDRPTRETATGGAADSDLETGRTFDWEEIRSRIEGADWVKRGYRGIVGLDPGIHVTIYGVESAQLAMTVCDDTLGALAAEAANTEVAIEVHGLHEGLLARTIGGDCVLR